MDRRAFLRSTGAVAALGLAGCLERLGFEEQSAWRDPPLVEDRPDAVYVPASSEEMGVYGRATDWEYAVELSYTFPHRFWTVSGTDRNRVVVDADDTMHLMITPWDAETDTVLPLEMRVDILRDGERVASEFSPPWPMISQRMGFHYGNNVVLPEEGEYTARISVGPVSVRRTGELEDRFDSSATLEIEFVYDRSDVHDLEFVRIDPNRHGERDALSPMDHDAHDHGGQTDTDSHVAMELGPTPTSQGPPVEDLPGTVLGTDRSGDAKISAIETDRDRFTDGDGTYLAVTLRTPYNGVVLPFTALTATVERDGDAILDAEPLVETVDHAFGHHYGVGVDALEGGDEVTISVDVPPGVARHDGYETAFFEFGDVEFTV